MIGAGRRQGASVWADGEGAADKAPAACPVTLYRGEWPSFLAARRRFAPARRQFRLVCRSDRRYAPG